MLAIAAIASTRFSTRLGLPALVLFVGLGIFAGSSGPVGIEFSDYALSYDIGLAACLLTYLELLWSLLLGSDGDSAAVAAIVSSLMGRSLPSRVSGTVETESGNSDPIALLMTLSFSRAIASGSLDVASLIV